MRRLMIAAALSLLMFAAGSFVPASAVPPPRFTLSPDPLTMSSAAGTIAFADVTLTNNRGVLVVQGPSTVHNDQTNPDGIHVIFSDTQSGTCWQTYESLGNPIPQHSTCTIRIGFLPPAQDTYTGTLTVYRCPTWHVDPTFGFILCDTTDGSQTINLVGTGT